MKMSGILPKFLVVLGLSLALAGCGVNAIPAKDEVQHRPVRARPGLLVSGDHHLCQLSPPAVMAALHMVLRDLHVTGVRNVNVGTIAQLRLVVVDSLVD